MDVLIFTNIPSPYRVDFFNELGKHLNLTVVFEAKTARGLRFNWNLDKISSFKAVFLKDGDMYEKKINWKVLKYIDKDKYDYIIVTNYSYLTEMVALLYLKIHRIPYFLEIDGGIIKQENTLKKLFKRFLIKNATGYFSPSRVSDEYLKYYGANKKNIYRYPFTSLNNQDILAKPISKYEKESLRSELGIKEKKVVLAVGRFIYIKGFDVLLKASIELEQEVAIVFVGGVPPKEYIDIKEKHNLQNIYFEGFKKKKELNKYYKVADVFVLPTRGDVWGLVINEAMGFGLPIITTEKCIAGLELIEDGVNGYIIPVNNHNILAETINELLYSENLINHIPKNNLMKIRNYTIKKMVDAHLNVFMKNKGAEI